MPITRKKMIVAVEYYLVMVVLFFYLYQTKKIGGTFLPSIYAVMFLFILPSILIKSGFGDKVAKYFWTIKKDKKQFLFGILVIYLMSLLSWYFVVQLKMKGMGFQSKEIVILFWQNLIILPLGFLAQEFFFRGFLLKNFVDNFNKLFSITATSFLAVVFWFVFNKAVFDWRVLLGVLILNLGLSWLVVRFRSVIYSFLIYWAGWIVLNFIILWQVGQKIIK